MCCWGHTGGAGPGAENRDRVERKFEFLEINKTVFHISRLLNKQQNSRESAIHLEGRKELEIIGLFLRGGLSLSLCLISLLWYPDCGKYLTILDVVISRSPISIAGSSEHSELF